MGLFDIFNGGRRSAFNARPRLTVQEWPAAIYAIGDVHGGLAVLLDLEARIVADAAIIDGEKWIVMLGDYVDRGPDSAGVLDHLLRPAPTGFSRTMLAGNHEDLMLDFLRSPDREHDWLKFGGIQTLESYGVDVNAIVSGRLSRRMSSEVLASYIPQEHIALLQGLPVALALPGMVFVHAGLRRGVPLERQSERDMLWLRPDPDEREEDQLDGLLVVHGHTPVTQPFVSRYRIGIDTGAFSTGVLTAARLGQDGLQKLLATDPPPPKQRP
ncbi:MAG TPA: metallophosphoesterase family protein [Devosia sp.]|nr:metallophosphoesterase family protein [Devosia sp.]